MTWWRNDCLGWGDTPLTAATETLAAALDVEFMEREGYHMGIHYVAESSEVTVDVLDNYGGDYPRDGEDTVPRREPQFPEHRTLVYVEGEDPTWWSRHEPTLRGIPNLVPLYSCSADQGSGEG
jgi:hypothetical protein